MKDIKLTIEEIKKIFECFEVEGFEYKASKYNSLDDQIRFSNGDYARRYDILSDEWKFDKLGDFLQRVIEGLDKAYTCNETEYRVLYNHIDKEYIVDYRGTGNLLGVNGFSIGKGGHDQAKTKAIKYILDKL